MLVSKKALEQVPGKGRTPTAVELIAYIVDILNGEI